MIHMSQFTDFGRRPIFKFKIFERPRFQGSYYCSNLKFCIRISTRGTHKNQGIMTQLSTDFGLVRILQG